MEISKKIICRLCLNDIKNSNFKKIEETVREVLDIVIPKLNLKRKDEDVLCDLCRTKLLAALNFKSLCINTEDIIYPYLDSGKTSALDLGEIYMKEKQNGLLTDLTGNNKVCRLCMELVKSEFILLEHIDVAKISIYIPEVNMESTKNPIVCKVCYDLFDTHSTFLKDCLAMVQAADCKSESKDISTELDIKTEEIEMKGEECNQQVESHDSYDDEIVNNLLPSENVVMDMIEEILEIHDCEVQGDMNVKPNFSSDISSTSYLKKNAEDMGEMERSKMYLWTYIDVMKPRDASQIQIHKYKCDSQIENTKSNLKFHRLTNKTALDVQMCESNECGFKSKIESNPRNRQKLHKDPKEIRMYKCDRCDFQSKDKKSFLVHRSQHVYKCDICNFQTKIKRSLKKHELKHEIPRNVYKCDICTFKTVRKRGLVDHQLIHKDPCDVQMYKCDKCDFQSKHRRSLSLHRLRHLDPSETPMYKCGSCDFQTKIKNSLRKHQLRHENAVNGEVYECDNCGFKAKCKKSLIDHLLIHKDACEVKMYKCDECVYQTKRRRNLERHCLTHKSSLEVRMYECDKCAFKTKYNQSLKNHQRTHLKTHVV